MIRDTRNKLEELTAWQNKPVLDVIYDFYHSLFIRAYLPLPLPHHSLVMIKHISVLSMLCLLIAACQSKMESTLPTKERITESVYASGFLRSQHQYQVFPKANGILEKIWVKEGDKVQKGQILFSLSNQVNKLNVDNASLAAANADIKSNEDKLEELRLTIELSKKKMDNDLVMMKRQQKLWDEQIGTRLELEQRELAYSNSKIAYESAQLRLAELKKQIQFTSNQTQKNLSISQSLLNDYTLRSEISGKIYSIQKEQGEMVSPQMPLAVVGDASEFTLILQVDENDIVKVKSKQRVLISMDSYKGQLFEAEIERINPLMNERSRTFEVEARFTKGPEQLFPNLTLEANIILQSKEQALTIPRRFIIDEEYVYISSTEKKKIKIGLSDFQKAEVLEGLSPTDKIYLPLQ